MYSVVLVMALSNGAPAPVWQDPGDKSPVATYADHGTREYRGRRRGGGGCCGCCGGYGGGCYGGGGCWGGGGCYGGGGWGYRSGYYGGGGTYGRSYYGDGVYHQGGTMMMPMEGGNYYGGAEDAYRGTTGRERGTSDRGTSDRGSTGGDRGTTGRERGTSDRERSTSPPGDMDRNRPSTRPPGGE